MKKERFVFFLNWSYITITFDNYLISKFLSELFENRFLKLLNFEDINTNFFFFFDLYNFNNLNYLYLSNFLQECYIFYDLINFYICQYHPSVLTILFDLLLYLVD